MVTDERRREASGAVFLSDGTGHGATALLGSRGKLGGLYRLILQWRPGLAIKTVNLKSDMPSVEEALRRLDRELALARQGKISLLKIVHGYGSSGAGGDIRIAVQRRLHELAEAGQLRGCIYGENWSKTDDETWRLLQLQSALKSDPDLGRRNLGITVVLL